MVRFRSGMPTGIYYSQHSDGAAYDWDDATLSMENGRVCWYDKLTNMDWRSNFVVAACVQCIWVSCKLAISRVGCCVLSIF
jgi:hypothetical protein